MINNKYAKEDIKKLTDKYKTIYKKFLFDPKNLSELQILIFEEPTIQKLIKDFYETSFKLYSNRERLKNYLFYTDESVSNEMLKLNTLLLQLTSFKKDINKLEQARILKDKDLKNKIKHFDETHSTNLSERI